MKFLGQGFGKLEHKPDRQMQPNALPQPHLQVILIHRQSGLARSLLKHLKQIILQAQCPPSIVSVLKASGNPVCNYQPQMHCGNVSVSLSFSCVCLFCLGF